MVDSSEDDLELMVELLKQSGYSVRQAVTGAAALEQMFQLVAPVVLIDDDLHDVTGIDLSRQLKAAAEVVWGCDCTTIAIRRDLEHDQLAGWAGADHIILKPVNLMFLMR